MKKMLICLLMILAVACTKTGSIKISTKSNLQTKTIVPNFDMNISDYVISGVNGEHTFSETTNENILVKEGLALGVWTIIVDARNGNSDVVGRGSGVTTVYANNQSQLNITVRPLTGDGSIAINMTWDTTVDNVVAVGKLIKEGQEDINFNLNVEQPNRLATYSSGLSAGYYFLTLQLLIGDVPAGGAMESVRIIEGVQTQVNVNLIVNQGSAGITIDLDMGDPIEIQLSDAPGTVLQGDTVVIKAIPTNLDNLDNTTAYFFIDGILSYETLTIIDGGFEYIFVCSLPLGSHRIDVAIIKTGDVIKMGSISHTIVVESLALLAPYDLTATVVSSNQIDLQWKQDNIGVVDGWVIDRKQGVDGAWEEIAIVEKDTLLVYEEKLIDTHLSYLKYKKVLYKL